MEDPKDAAPRDNRVAEGKSEADAAPATDGKTTPETSSWMDDLPKPLRESKSLAKFQSKDKLAESYLALEGKLGRSIELPGKDAKPEDLERFLTKLGRPAKPEEYNLEPVEGFEAPEDYLHAIRGAFHAAGLTNVQANALHRFIAGNVAEGSIQTAQDREAMEKEAKAQATKAREESEQTLRNAWGLNFDTRLEYARRFVQNEGGERAVEHLEKLGVASDPVLLQLFAKAGSALGSARFVTGTAPKGQVSNPYDYMKKDLGLT